MPCLPCLTAWSRLADLLCKSMLHLHKLPDNTKSKRYMYAWCPQTTSIQNLLLPPPPAHTCAAHVLCIAAHSSSSLPYLLLGRKVLPQTARRQQQQPPATAAKTPIAHCLCPAVGGSSRHRPLNLNAALTLLTLAPSLPGVRTHRRGLARQRRCRRWAGGWKQGSRVGGVQAAQQRRAESEAHLRHPPWLPTSHWQPWIGLTSGR